MAKTFGAESTAHEVLEGVNLSGRPVLITGVSAGLGVDTLRSLVAHGATVVGTARDLAKARRALAEAGEPACRSCRNGSGSRSAACGRRRAGLLTQAKALRRDHCERWRDGLSAGQDERRFRNFNSATSIIFSGISYSSNRLTPC